MFLRKDNWRNKVSPRPNGNVVSCISGSNNVCTRCVLDVGCWILVIMVIENKTRN